MMSGKTDDVALDRSRLPRWLSSAVVALGLACLGCGKEAATGPGGSEHRPGTLVLRLTTPNVDDLAIRILISGGPLESVQKTSESVEVHSRITAHGAVLLVVGAIRSGELVKISVPDLERQSDYKAKIVDAADGSTALRGSLTGYAVVIAP